METKHSLQNDRWPEKKSDIAERLRELKAGPPTWEQFEYMLVQTRFAVLSFRYHFGKKARNCLRIRDVQTRYDPPVKVIEDYEEQQDERGRWLLQGAHNKYYAVCEWETKARYVATKEKLQFSNGSQCKCLEM